MSASLCLYSHSVIASPPAQSNTCSLRNVATAAHSMGCLRSLRNPGLCGNVEETHRTRVPGLIPRDSRTGYATTYSFSLTTVYLV